MGHPVATGAFDPLMRGLLRTEAGRRTLLGRLNTTWHRRAIIVFVAITVAHWVEHIAQAMQIWLFHWPRAEAKGLLGLVWPWLIREEWLHFGFAVVIIVPLWLLLPGFSGTARRWWLLAFAVQAWHYVEHLGLLVQALIGVNLAGRAAPTSFLQLMFQRAELHLWYNALVTVPMAIALLVYLRPARPRPAPLEAPPEPA